MQKDKKVKLTAKQKEVVERMRSGEELDADINSNNGLVTKHRIGSTSIDKRIVGILYRHRIIDQYWNLTELGKTIKL